MKVVNINKALFIGIISLIVVNSCFLIYHKYMDKETNIPKVKLKDQENKKDTFAIMLEQEDGTYQATTSTSFDQPGYRFNNEKSGCIDINGNKIDNAISYNETSKTMIVSVSNTAYCYVYFDLKPNKDAAELINSGELWESGLDGDGYRYTGTNPANYICFGTTNKDTCIGNTDAYMYRIIGVFPDSEGNQHIKLIKKEALNTERAWNDANSDVDWSSSTLFNVLNGSTVFLKNNTYMPTDGTKNWSDRITDWTWSAVDTRMGSSGPNYVSISARQIYLHELNRNGRPSGGRWTTPSGKIGLIYVSDYLMSLGSSTLSGTRPSDSTYKTSWMYLASNDTGAPSNVEWTISRDGRSSGMSAAWYVGDTMGTFAPTPTNTKISARPVFYLNSDQVISSGEGKIDNPYILKN